MRKFKLCWFPSLTPPNKAIIEFALQNAQHLLTTRNVVTLAEGCDSHIWEDDGDAPDDSFPTAASVLFRTHKEKREAPKRNWASTHQSLADTLINPRPATCDDEGCRRHCNDVLLVHLSGLTSQPIVGVRLAYKYQVSLGAEYCGALAQA